MTIVGIICANSPRVDEQKFLEVDRMFKNTINCLNDEKLQLSYQNKAKVYWWVKKLYMIIRSLELQWDLAYLPSLYLQQTVQWHQM